MSKTLILILTIILSGCSNSTLFNTKSKTKKIVKPIEENYCICLKIYHPVCGRNKKTYGNSCLADCEDMKYTDGQCDL